MRAKHYVGVKTEYSGVKGSWINFTLISEVTYATKCLLLADSTSTVFFSILNHSALYSNTSKNYSKFLPRKIFNRISCCSLLKSIININIRLSDIQNPSKSYFLRIQCHFSGLIEVGRPQYCMFPEMLLPVFQYTWHEA